MRSDDTERKLAELFFGKAPEALGLRCLEVPVRRGPIEGKRVSLFVIDDPHGDWPEGDDNG